MDQVGGQVSTSGVLEIDVDLNPHDEYVVWGTRLSEGSRTDGATSCACGGQLIETGGQPGYQE